MNVTIPDSLKDFLDRQVRGGRYINPDAFVAELIRTEAEMQASADRGEPLPIDGHFDRRLEALLDEASASGDYVGALPGDFDDMEGEALDLIRKRKSS
jgi:Arc/MetJ-type ribon-helix-helix transcriptional regulator